MAAFGVRGQHCLQSDDDVGRISRSPGEFPRHEHEKDGAATVDPVSLSNEIENEFKDCRETIKRDRIFLYATGECTSRSSTSDNP